MWCVAGDFFRGDAVPGGGRRVQSEDAECREEQRNESDDHQPRRGCHEGGSAEHEHSTLKKCWIERWRIKALCCPSFLKPSHIRKWRKFNPVCQTKGSQLQYVQNLFVLYVHNTINTTHAGLTRQTCLYSTYDTLPRVP